MKVISIIGTRPQYIKIRPIHDYCFLNKIDHKIIDTRQHYSHNVSDALIKDLSLKIDISLALDISSEINFILDCTKNLYNALKQHDPDIVIVYGDTNSTFCAALAAYKLGIKVAHVESGERCFDNSVPEEVNRIFVDTVSSFNFCSSKDALNNIRDGIFSGDLQYELLNNIDPEISYQKFGVMTIHRQSNCKKESIDNILLLCSKIPFNIKFYVHHRIKSLLPEKIPNNINLLESCPYTEMVNQLSACSFVITDSGGIQKTSAFFGKKTLIMRDTTEWREVERLGVAKLCGRAEDDLDLLTSFDQKRYKKCYLRKDGVMPTELIFKTIEREINNGK